MLASLGEAGEEFLRFIEYIMLVGAELMEAKDVSKDYASESSGRVC